MKDFVVGATNGTDYANAAINYHLDDTVANIANVAVHPSELRQWV
ncbi:MAG: hypothetical protein ACLSB9_31105 [Hydrogeniiclostridium mannosilyticum]